MTSRDVMLDAAEEVVLRDGLGSLALDAVAREAGLSKGGLMHHFPTKDALIDAMVRRKVDAWRAEWEGAIERQPRGRGRVLRALLGLCFGESSAAGDPECRRCFVLIAALVHDAKHVEAMRESHRALAALVEKDGLPPGLGAAVHLALNGLWFDRMFGLSVFPAGKVSEVRRAILSVLDAPQGKGASRRSARSVRARASTPKARSGGPKKRASTVHTKPRRTGS